MITHIKRPPFDKDKPFVVLRSFKAVGKQLNAGDSFQWQEWKIPFRRVTQLWDLRFISNESDALLQHLEKAAMEADVAKRQEGVETTDDGMYGRELTPEEIQNLEPNEILLLHPDLEAKLDLATTDEEIAEIMVEAINRQDLGLNAEVLAQAQNVESEGAENHAPVQPPWK